MREHSGQSLSVGSGGMGSGGLPYTWVGSDQALFEMIEALGPVGAPQSQIAGMDSEFISRPGVFRLCVLQVQIGPNTYLIDTLEDLNIGLMRDFLQRQDLVFVLHSAGQDLELLHNRYGVTIPHLFDTYIAAKYVTGEGNKMGLKAVMQQFLGIPTFFFSCDFKPPSQESKCQRARK